MSPSSSDENIAITRRSLGSSPRIHPRPPYPSPWFVLSRGFLSIGVRFCLLGYILAVASLPVYRWTRRNIVVDPLEDHPHQNQHPRFLLGDDRWYFTLLMTLAHTGTYVLFALPYLILDMCSIGQTYKLYRKPYMTPTAELLKKMALDQVFNHLVATPVLLYWVVYPVAYNNHNPLLAPLDAPFPSATTIVVQMACFTLTNDVIFYMVHRMLHSKLLYKYVHKQHHEFSGTVAYAAEYSHPMENLLANQGPMAVASWILSTTSSTPCHFFVLWWFVVMRVQEAYQTHSGYMIGRPLDYRTIFHDHHHTYNQGNFGAFYLDYIFGTMDHFQSIGGFEGYMKLSSKT